LNKLLTRFVGGLLAVCSVFAHSAAFPERHLDLIVPFGPGGTTDVIARALAAEMGKVLGQQVVVLNKAGAGGAIGAAAVANAKNDGYTLGMLPVGPLTTQPNLQRLSYGPGSFEYVCRVYANPQVVLVRKNSPYQTVQDVVAAAKRDPGKLNYASTGTGSVPHLALAALSEATGVKMTHVPYKGDADSLLALVSGQVTMLVSHPTMLSTHADSVRAIAVLSANRLKEFPDVPTLSEQGGPALNFEVWGGLAVPKDTPQAAVAALENSCLVGTSSETFRKQMESLNTPVNYMDGKSFGAYVGAEFERNGRLLRQAGIEKQ
jgi:tripartite-type tricarboxylate transporter receptor subunit TctC